MTKYFDVVQALPEQTANGIPALLQSPPAGDPYQALKNKLISMYNQTNFQHAELLTALPSATADMRLSELLNRMLALLPLEEVNRQGFLFIHMLLMPSVGNSATGTASTMTFGEQMPGWSCRCMCQRPCNFLGGINQATLVSSLSSPSSSSSPLPSPSSLSSPLSRPPLHRHLGPLVLWIASSTSATHCRWGLSLLTGALQSASSSFQSCSCSSSGGQRLVYTNSFVFHHFYLYSTSSLHLGFHPCRSRCNFLWHHQLNVSLTRNLLVWVNMVRKVGR